MTLEQRLAELLERLSPKIREAFQRAIADVVDNVILRQVVEAIEQNNVEAAFRALGYSPAVFNPLISSMQDALSDAGAMIMSSFPRHVEGRDGVKVVLRFDVRDPLAEQWLRDQSSRLITDVENDIRTNVRDTLTAGMAEGRNPRSVALDIVGRLNPTTGHREGGVVGLGAREALWSRNARQRLLTLDERYFDMKLRDKRFDATVRKAIEAGKPLPADTVDKLVDRYRANALRHRGETIGRTEAIQALNRSEFVATKQGVDAGDIPARAVKRIWDSAGDGRVRPSHRALDGQTVGMDEPFVSPVSGARMMHPGDTSLGAGGEDVIACRCRVRTIVDWAYGVK